MECNLQTCL